MMRVGKLFSGIVLFSLLLVGCDQSETQTDPNNDVHIEVNVPGMDEPIIINGEVTDDPIIIDIPDTNKPETDDDKEVINVPEEEVKDPVAELYEYLGGIIEYYNYEDPDFDAYFDYFEAEDCVYINIYDQYYTYDDYYYDAINDPYSVEETGINLETYVNETFAEVIREIGITGSITIDFASSDGMKIFWYEVADGVDRVTYCDTSLPRPGMNDGGNSDQNSYADELSDITIQTNGSDSYLIENVEDLIPDQVELQIVDTTSFIEIIGGSQDDFLDEMADEPIDDGLRDYTGITGYGYSEYTVVYCMEDIYVVLHELGHAFDYSFWYYGQNSLSEYQEWINAYQSEYITDYGTTCVEEFFAEAFAYYFLDPQYLQQTAPYAYELLQYSVGAY